MARTKSRRGAAHSIVAKSGTYHLRIVSTQGESPIQNLALEISLSTAGEVEEEVEEESPDTYIH